MNLLKMGSLTLGDGKPKICVPIVAQTLDGILEAARGTLQLPADLIEWRVDWFDEAFQPESVLGVLEALALIRGDRPLLFTFRTAAEGGEKAITPEAYFQLNQLAIASKQVDAIDVEAYFHRPTVEALIQLAHQQGVKVVASNHDFNGTPSKDEILRRLCEMQTLGADLPKIAVMPQNPGDVLTLLDATWTMAQQFADRPIATMSMASDGLISRLSGETFGSAMTFGAADRPSAPGQMGAKDLASVLDQIHTSINPKGN